MEGTMKTAVMLGVGEMGFEEREIPAVKDNEVLVKLEYIGIWEAICITMRRAPSAIM